VSFALRTEGLCKTYGTLPVLRNIDMTLAPGERLGILGPSGCGKTTLLRVALGLEHVSSGTVEGRLDRTGYLPQGNLLLPWKRVLENVELPLQFRGVERKVRQERARELLSSVGLEAFASAYPFEISGGMQQRVALLRALIAKAPMLILDEPFGALDTMTRQRLQDWLVDLANQWELAMLFVTHDLEEAIVLAQRVLVLSDRPGTVIGGMQIALDADLRHNRLSGPFLELREALVRLVAGDPSG